MNRRKSSILRTVAGVALPLLLTGCITTYQDQARQEAQTRSTYELLDEENRRISGRMEGLEMQLDDIRRELNGLRTTAMETGQASSSVTQARLDSIEAKLVMMEQERERDRQEIVDKLTERVAAIMKTQSSAGAPRASRSSPVQRSEYGFEHVVQPGETMSHISQAYGVTIQAIIDENGIANANDLKVGQKLFIPE